MKISYNWLKELVEIDLPPRELAERLTMVGLPVDSVEQVGDDYILEFDLTSNRPDCLSHFGIAREAALLCNSRAELPLLKLQESEQLTRDVTSVEILDADLCPRYVARVVLGAKVGPSPAWLADRLQSCGIRSINNIADITNYVLLEQGQPLHAFDFNKLRGRRIVVRTARPGEMLRTLDGVERQLSREMLVIADGERPVALAGIMGGEETEISAETTDILLESAYFSPASIRRTSRALGLSTEASYRFERGADYEATLRAANRCVCLICELAGGTLLKQAIDVYPQPIVREPVGLRYRRVRALTGLEVDKPEVERILLSLGFTIEPLLHEEEWMVLPPTFRTDISREEDLIEEVARHVGYDKIETTLPGWGGSGSYLVNEDRRRKLRQTLADYGFNEAISFSFVDGSRDELFRPGGADAIELRNPIIENARHMRTNLLAGLLEAVARNFNFGTRNVKLFETGKCFFKNDSEQRPDERERLALVVTGLAREDDWKAQTETVDFYYLKGVIEALLDKLHLKDFYLERSASSYLHPGQSAALIFDGRTVGAFGRLHPRVAAIYKFKQPVFVAELELDRLLDLPAARIVYKPLPKFPTVSRDISILISNRLAYEEIKRAIEGLGIAEIRSVKLFDVYTGKNLPEGSISLSINLRYRSDDRTLTEEEVNERHERVVQLLKERFGAELR